MTVESTEQNRSLGTAMAMIEAGTAVELSPGFFHIIPNDSPEALVRWCQIETKLNAEFIERRDADMILDPEQLANLNIRFY